MLMIEIEGKRGRTVAVFIPQYVVHSLYLLLQVCNQTVTDENQYLFPTVQYGSLSHICGSDCLRKFSAECGVIAPDRLRSFNVREHIATTNECGGK